MKKVLSRHIIEVVESHNLGKAHKPGKITASWFPFWATLARWHHDFMSLDFKTKERPHLFLKRSFEFACSS